MLSTLKKRQKEADLNFLITELPRIEEAASAFALQDYTLASAAYYIAIELEVNLYKVGRPSYAVKRLMKTYHSITKRIEESLKEQGQPYALRPLEKWIFIFIDEIHAIQDE